MLSLAVCAGFEGASHGRVHTHAHGDVHTHRPTQSHADPRGRTDAGAAQPSPPSSAPQGTRSPAANGWCSPLRSPRPAGSRRLWSSCCGMGALWCVPCALRCPPPPPQGSIRMVVHRRTRGVPPLNPPPPPDQSDYRGQKRNLPSGKFCQAIFCTQNFESQTPPPLPPFYYSPGSACPPLPTKVTIAGKNEVYRWENRVGPFLGPRPPPPLRPVLILPCHPLAPLPPPPPHTHNALEPGSPGFGTGARLVTMPCSTPACGRPRPNAPPPTPSPHRRTALWQRCQIACSPGPADKAFQGHWGKPLTAVVKKRGGFLRADLVRGRVRDAPDDGGGSPLLSRLPATRSSSTPGRGARHGGASGFCWQPLKKTRGRQVMCLRLSFSRVLSAVWGECILGWCTPRGGGGPGPCMRHPPAPPPPPKF